MKTSEPANKASDILGLTDGLRYPEALRDMALTVQNYYSIRDKAAWRDLISDIRAAAEKLDEIDIDE